MTSPSFIIVGAERCGSTSLYSNICMHPKVTAAYQKELEFFDKNFSNGFGWYINQFRGTFSGEATPTYFWNPLAAERIKRYYPGTKIIVITRDVVDAVVSKYWQQVMKGVERRPLREAIFHERTITLGEIQRLQHGFYPALFSEYAYTQRYSSEHLQMWKRMFGAIEVRLQDLAADPAATMRRVYEALGLEVPDGFIESVNWDVMNKGMNYPAIDIETRNFIIERGRLQGHPWLEDRS